MGPRKGEGPGAEPSTGRGKQHGSTQTDRCGGFRSGGVEATARWQGHAKQLERPSSSRREIGGAENCITGNTGKSMEDERELEGSIVSMKRGNARGERGPCCLQWLEQNGRQGGYDKDTQRFGGAEEEPIRQGEGRTNQACLGTVRPCLQNGKPSGSLR